MDSRVIFQKVPIIPMRIIFRIFEVLFKVSSSASETHFSMNIFSLALGWDREKVGIIGHSYGAMLGMTVVFTDSIQSIGLSLF